MTYRKVKTGPHSFLYKDDGWFGRGDDPNRPTRWQYFWAWLCSYWQDDLIFLGIAIVFLIGCSMFVMWALSSPSSTFSLKKTEWYCSQEHSSFILIPQYAGKTMIMTYIPTSICINYHHNGF